MTLPNDPRKIEEYRRKISNSKRGANNPNFKKTFSEETRRKMSTAMKGRVFSEETRRKLGEANSKRVWSEESLLKMSETRKGRPALNKGIPMLEEQKRKLSEARKGKYTGENSPLWKGGISFEPYCPKFTKEFKERVRAFFGYRCIECETPQNRYKLPVHHVNFNKKACCDSTPPLFVPLCRSCHAKTQSNRPYWQQHFTDVISLHYGGKCYLTKEEASAAV